QRDCFEHARDEEDDDRYGLSGSDNVRIRAKGSGADLSNAVVHSAHADAQEVEQSAKAAPQHQSPQASSTCFGKLQQVEHDPNPRDPELEPVEGNGPPGGPQIKRKPQATHNPHGAIGDKPQQRYRN